MSKIYPFKKYIQEIAKVQQLQMKEIYIYGEKYYLIKKYIKIQLYYYLIQIMK